MDEKVLVAFKDEIYKHVSETENSYKNSYIAIKEFVEEKMKLFNEAYERFGMQMIDIQTANVAERVKLDKIDGLERHKDASDDTFFTINNTLKKIQQDLTGACAKYDKIFLENLEVPGIIGDFCKFKNMRQYVEQNRKEMEALENFKEKLTIEFKSVRNSLDMNVKMMSDHQDNLERRIKEFCYNIVQNSENSTKEEIKSIQESFNSIKMENGKYHVEAMKLVKETSIKLDDLNEMKVELDYQREKEAKNSAQFMKEMEAIKVEHGGLKTNNKDLNDSLKEIRKKIAAMQSILDNQKRFDKSTTQLPNIHGKDAKKVTHKEAKDLDLKKDKDKNADSMLRKDKDSLESNNTDHKLVSNHLDTTSIAKKEVDILKEDLEVSDNSNQGENIMDSSLDLTDNAANNPKKNVKGDSLFVKNQTQTDPIEESKQERKKNRSTSKEFDGSSPKNETKKGPLKKVNTIIMPKPIVDLDIEEDNEILNNVKKFKSEYRGLNGLNPLSQNEKNFLDDEGSFGGFGNDLKGIISDKFPTTSPGMKKLRFDYYADNPHLHPLQPIPPIEYQMKKNNTLATLQSNNKGAIKSPGNSKSKLRSKKELQTSLTGQVKDQQAKSTMFDFQDKVYHIDSNDRVRTAEENVIPSSSILKNSAIKNVIESSNKQHSNVINNNTQTCFFPNKTGFQTNLQSQVKRVNKTASGSQAISDMRIDIRKLNRIEKNIYYNLLKTVERDNEFKECLQITHSSPKKFDDGRSKGSKQLKV